MIIQIEITIITKCYHKITRKMFMQVRALIQDNSLNQNRIINMIISSMIHQTNIKILKHIKI
jgi:hypothetical protein